MPCYKIHYFNARGAAENARIMFHLKGVEFEDKRYAGESWMKFKPHTPNGQLPVLEVDGKSYPQSGAIDWFLAEKFGYAGKNAEDRLLIHVLIGNKQDVVKHWPFGEADEAVKQKKIAKCLDEIVPEFLKKVEKELEERNTKSGFFLEEVSLADINLLNFYSFYTHKGRRPNGFDGFPRVKGVVDTLCAIPNVKKYLEAREETEF